MFRPSLLAAASFAAFALAAGFASAQNVAPTPPMGWNSWDAYGLTIDEDDYRANSTVLAGLEPYGWKYSVIDEGWYMENPFGTSVENRKYVWDGNGILIPALDRFPSAAQGAGFKPLADWVHAQGLKFGIHIVRGIPRQVVKENLPIAGSGFRAAEAADLDSPCPWDEGNWGVKNNAAGQAYYDSMMKLYAGWGLDFIKVDCISDHPYRPTEIRQMAEAIRKTGRPIVLSLSPGPTQLDHAAEVAKYAQMWRISDDHWDVWTAEHKPGAGEFPFGIRDAFDRLAEWAPYVKPGSWPDDDMLPWGWLGPHPGWGEPRQSRETHDEQRTEFTLWAISRSPLILGANLTRLDDFTRSLITNKEVLSINQTAVESGPGLMPMREGKTDSYPQRYWYARTGGAHPRHYLAVFSLTDSPSTSDLPWMVFHLADKPHAVYDIWNQRHVPRARALHVELPPHGCALFRVE
jgi:alpha-galactosidase